MRSLVNFRILFLVAALALLLGVQVPGSEAATGDAPLHGYAWSDNIGWLSFSCENTSSCATSNYGVIIDASGVLSGYAWSDNVGWISFHAFDLVGCPSGVCEARYNSDSGKLSGWARALAYRDSERGGWEGWISLSGASYGVTVNSSTGDLGNYAWSDTVIGWLSFNCENFGGDTNTCGFAPYKVYALFFDIPLVETKANGVISSVTINQGQSARLTWTVQNVDSCTPSSSPVDSTWNGHAITLPSGYFDVTPTQTTTYTLNCTGPKGSVSSSVTVNVQAAQTAVCGNNILESPEECDDGNVVSGDGCSATCVREFPEVQPYFNLEAAPSSVPVTFAKGAAESCADVTTITVNDLGTGYNKDVTLSVSDWGGLSHNTYSFTPLSLSSAQYSTGSKFNVCIPSSTTQGVYGVSIQGTGADGKTDTVEVLFNVLIASPTWKEI
ncbi:MAG: DUF4215 domain-containing protein [Candidatus Niyogibacteria bacterium]|nr:DUF4215 domain-containing protein [Candidatus Niyogibacteria bacterium]